MNKKKILNLKKLFLASALFFSFLSSPLNANTKVLRVGAIPDQNQDVLDKRYNLLSNELSKTLDVDVKYIPVIN